MPEPPTSLASPPPEPAPAASVHTPAASQDPAHQAWIGPPVAVGPAGTVDPFGRPIPRPPKRSRIRERASAIGAGVIAIIAKFKAILLILPKIKLLTTASTAIVSVVAYSLFFGWWFAVGFVVLLFIHEMGHVIALRREGIPASAPMFIPFLGAVITARTLGDNALAEARVGLAGPILGSVGAAACALIGIATGSDLLQALAYTGFFLNLFNLIPVVPLDGGRAMAAMSPAMWLVGFLGMLALGFVSGNPILFVFAAIGGFESWRRWKLIRQRSLVTAAYYRVSPRARLAVGGVYVGLMFTLALAMWATYVPHSVGFGRY
ncbi:MAG TPA: site-2 protease family protein [Solirubrobacteraceae bacterium]